VRRSFVRVAGAPGAARRAHVEPRALYRAQIAPRAEHLTVRAANLDPHDAAASALVEQFLGSPRCAARAARRATR
jgi:hypothetical protein